MQNPTQPSRPTERSRIGPLKYAFDSQFIPATPRDDTSVETTEPNNNDSHTEQSSKSHILNHSRTGGLATSLRVMGESMLKMELAGLEMMKQREIARAEAEMQRAKLEYETTRMMLQTQLQIASLVSQKCKSRKRKRASTNDGSSSAERDGALIMSLLHCNLM